MSLVACSMGNMGYILWIEPCYSCYSGSGCMDDVAQSRNLRDMRRTWEDLEGQATGSDEGESNK